MYRLMQDAGGINGKISLQCMIRKIEQWLLNFPEETRQKTLPIARQLAVNRSKAEGRPSQLVVVVMCLLKSGFFRHLVLTATKQYILKS